MYCNDYELSDDWVGISPQGPASTSRRAWEGLWKSSFENFQTVATLCVEKILPKEKLSIPKKYILPMECIATDMCLIPAM